MRMRIFFGKSKFRNDFVCAKELYIYTYGLGGDWEIDKGEWGVYMKIKICLV